MEQVYHIQAETTNFMYGQPYVVKDSKIQILFNKVFNFDILSDSPETAYKNFTEIVSQDGIINIKINNKSMEQTLGQKRVKAEFNPAKNDLVDQIKNKSAELIDLIETLNQSKTTSEQYRLIEKAQTDIETGCMYAVKACFTK